MGVSWGALGVHRPPVTKGVPKRRKRKGKEEREKRKKEEKKLKNKGVEQKREQIQRLINIAKGVSLRVASKADLGGASIFCRNRASDFVWAPQAKRKHQIVRISFEKYI